MTVREELEKKIVEKAELAATYLGDGAHNTAARILEDLTAEVRRHATNVDKAIADFAAAKRRGA